MVCPQCEHIFQIKDSIPNMVRSTVFARALELGRPGPSFCAGGEPISRC